MVKIEKAEVYEQWCDSCHCSSDEMEGIKKIHFGKDYGSGLDVRLCKSCRKLLAKGLELTDAAPDIHAKKPNIHVGVL